MPMWLTVEYIQQCHGMSRASGGTPLWLTVEYKQHVMLDIRAQRWVHTKADTLHIFIPKPKTNLAIYQYRTRT